MKEPSIILRSILLLILCMLLVACAVPAAPAAVPAAPAAAPAAVGDENSANPSEESSLLTKPELCSPDAPQLSGFVSIEQSDRRNYQVDETTFEAIYTNDKDQTFLFFATGIDGDYLRIRLEQMRLCAEAIDRGMPITNREESQGLTEDELKSTRDFLSSNPANMLMEMADYEGDVNFENEQDVHFFIDPTLDQDGRDDFRACNARSAAVSVSVASGKVSAALYKAGSFLDSTTTARPNVPSNKVEDNNRTTKITYDSIAKGASGSSYNIYGGWNKDSSGTDIQSSVSGCQ